MPHSSENIPGTLSSSSPSTQVDVQQVSRSESIPSTPLSMRVHSQVGSKRVRSQARSLSYKSPIVTVCNRHH